MDTTENTNLSSVSAPSQSGEEARSPKIISRPKKSPKPLVEGINAPVSVPSAPSLDSTVVPPKVSLTSLEKKLIEDQPTATVSPLPKIKISPMNPQKLVLPEKKSFWSKVIWSILISLLAVSVVLGLLFWYNNRSGETQGQFLNLFPKRPEVTTNQPAETVPTSTESQPATAPAREGVPAAVTATTSPATSTPSATPGSALMQVKVSSTPTGFLNVRGTPSTSGALLGKINPGEVYTYTETKSGWYHIVLSDGTTGWVIGQYVEVVK